VQRPRFFWGATRRFKSLRLSPRTIPPRYRSLRPHANSDRAFGSVRLLPSRSIRGARCLAQTGAITYPKALDADDIDKTITSKAEVIGWLTKSCDAVKTARAKETPAALAKKVHIADRDAPRDGIYCASWCMQTNTWASSSHTRG
jgi:hypothetical protein